MTCDGCGVPIESRWIMLIHVVVLGKIHHVLSHDWVLDMLVHDLLALENPSGTGKRCHVRFHPDAAAGDSTPLYPSLNHREGRSENPSYGHLTRGK